MPYPEPGASHRRRHPDWIGRAMASEAPTDTDQSLKAPLERPGVDDKAADVSAAAAQIRDSLQDEKD